MLATTLKDLKKARNMTAQQLADAANLPVDTVNKILSGATANPNAETLRRLASALGCSVDELLGEQKAPVSQAKSPEGVDDMQSALNTIKELYEARITDLWKTIAALKRDKAFLAGAILMLGIFILYLFVDGMHGNWGFFQYPTI